MQKEFVVKFEVTFFVSAEQEPETFPLRDAVLEGIYLAEKERYLTALESEDVVMGYGVTHTSTLCSGDTNANDNPTPPTL